MSWFQLSLFVVSSIPYTSAWFPLISEVRAPCGTPFDGHVFVDFVLCWFPLSLFMVSAVPTWIFRLPSAVPFDGVCRCVLLVSAVPFGVSAIFVLVSAVPFCGFSRPHLAFWPPISNSVRWGVSARFHGFSRPFFWLQLSLFMVSAVPFFPVRS